MTYEIFNIPEVIVENYRGYTIKAERKYDAWSEPDVHVSLLIYKSCKGDSPNEYLLYEHRLGDRSLLELTHFSKKHIDSLLCNEAEAKIIEELSPGE